MADEDHKALPYFVAGGTLSAQASSYVERAADHTLLTSLQAGKFCYVLNSRQMGKSSLCVRTMQALEAAGTRTAFVDLTKIGGRNVTPEQWYAGILVEIGRALDLRAEMLAYWKENAHVSPLQRLFGSLRDVPLAKLDTALVVFFDEIDATRSLSFSADEFFAAIRESYNRRVHDPVLARLSFCLLGVAVPSDLINSPTSTPFNIGERIYLQDFTTEEASALANGLGNQQQSTHNQQLLERVLHWTNGHPFLTQSLCQAVAADPHVKTADDVDALVRRDLFEPKARETNINLADVANRALHAGDLEGDPEKFRADLLSMYSAAWKGKAVADDEANRVAALLKLSGIMRSEGNQLKVRNRIYERVFDQTWIQENMPGQELRRQKRSLWIGVARASIVALLFLALLGRLVFTESSRKSEAAKARDAAIASQRAAEHDLYIARMNSLDLLARDGDSFEMHRILEETKASPWRGWEWLYWNGVLHDAPEEYSVKGWNGSLSASFSGNGSQLLITCDNGLALIADRKTKRVLWHGYWDTNNPIVWCGERWAKPYQSVAKKGPGLTDPLTGAIVYSTGFNPKDREVILMPVQNTNYVVIWRESAGGYYSSKVQVVDIRSNRTVWNYQSHDNMAIEYYSEPGATKDFLPLHFFAAGQTVSSENPPYGLLDLKSGRFVDKAGAITRGAIVSMNHRLWVRGLENGIELRHIPPAIPPKQISLPGAGTVEPIAYGFSGTSVFVRTQDSRVLEVDLANGSNRERFANAMNANLCAVTQEMALGGASIRVIRSSDGQGTQRISGLPTWLALGADYISLVGGELCTNGDTGNAILRWFSNPSLKEERVENPPGKDWGTLSAARGLWFSGRSNGQQILIAGRGMQTPRLCDWGSAFWCPDEGDRVFSFKLDGITAWSLSTGAKLWHSDLGDDIQNVGSPKDGSVIFVSSMSRQILLDAETGTKIGEPQSPMDLPAIDAGYDGDDYWISDSRFVRRFRGRSLSPSLEIPLKGTQYTGATLSPDDQRIALTDANGGLTILEKSSMRRLMKVRPSSSSTLRPCFTSDGKKLLFVSSKGVAYYSGSDEDPTYILDPGSAPAANR